MKKNQTLVLWMPAIVILIILGIAYKNVFNIGMGESYVRFMAINLLVILPIIFFVQGSWCGIVNHRTVIALVISLVTFMVMRLSLDNSPIIVELIIYAVTFIIGYLITSLLVKPNRKKPKDEF
ncbi:MAG: hypothetical protein ACRCST_07395 [Turicibacter sp.]